MSARAAVLLVVLAVSIGMLVSTGAFTTVAAERTVDIAIADDTSAVLKLAPYEDEQGRQSEFAGLVDGKLALDINVQSTVDAESVFTITNHGSQTVAVWITDVDHDDSGIGGVDENNTDAVTFYNPVYGGASSTENGKASVEGRENAVALDVGETLVVSIYIDTTALHEQEVDLLDGIVVHADANVDGNDSPTNVGSGDGGSGGGTGTSDIHPLPNQQVTFTSGESSVLAVGNKGSGTLVVSDLTIDGADADDFQVVAGDAPFSVEPGNGVTPTHTITIEYTGNGHAEANLRIHSNDPDEPIRTVELKGSPGEGQPANSDDDDGEDD